MTKPIVTNFGVKRGCVLSAPVFIIVMDCIMNMVTANKRRDITWKLTERLEDLDYADDICLLSVIQGYEREVGKSE